MNILNKTCRYSFLGCIKRSVKGISTNTTFSGNTQSEGNKKIVEIFQAFTPTIATAAGIYYLYSIITDNTNSIVKANKEIAEKEIKANKEIAQKESN